ncbi:hypothetical protein ACMXYX_17830 (plasmid) [Neptuniibacter sp. QD72_48]|uniref:hypothetical protein n=1 Tax=Neptuniibacter sp. QD72_48 TaxID=3398214 RepID=UPI0039F6274C
MTLGMFLFFFYFGIFHFISVNLLFAVVSAFIELGFNGRLTPENTALFIGLILVFGTACYLSGKPMYHVLYDGFTRYRKQF